MQLRAGIISVLLAAGVALAQPAPTAGPTAGPVTPQLPAAIPATEQLPLGAAARPAMANASESPHPTSSGLPTILALGVVIAAIIVVAFIVRKAAARGGGLANAAGAGGRAPSGVLEALGRYPLSRGTNLILLKLDRRVLLVAHTTGRSSAGVSTLCELTDPEDVASILLKTRDDAGDSLAKQFQNVLAREESSADATLNARPVQPIARRGPARPAATGQQAAAAVRARLAALATNPGPSLEVRG